jgi:hypothetical protein
VISIIQALHDEVCVGLIMRIVVLHAGLKTEGCDFEEFFYGKVIIPFRKSPPKDKIEKSVFSTDEKGFTEIIEK